VDKAIRKSDRIRRAVLEAVHSRYGAIFHFDTERTKAVVWITEPEKLLDPECEIGSARFRDLQQNLGLATRELIKILPPVRAQRMKNLECIESKARELLKLLAVDRAMSDMQWVSGPVQRRIVGRLGAKASTRFGGLLSSSFFPDAVKSLATVARIARKRVAAKYGDGAYDPLVVGGQKIYPSGSDITSYVGMLGAAYEQYFGERAGYSTAKKDEQTRGGPFIRFVIAASREVGHELSPEQIRNRTRAWRKRQGSKAK
jgi:hypothetical protein